MKFLIIAASIALSGVAYAGDNESPIKGRGPFSVLRNEAANGPSKGFTVQEISDALEAKGLGRLGSSRILSEDRPTRGTAR